MAVPPTTTVHGATVHHSAEATPDHHGAAHGIEAQPDAAYFELMASVAERHWWYRGRRALVAQLLGGRVRRGGTALDIGCGTSETLDTLRALGAAHAVGTDLSTEALAHARQRRVVPRPLVLRSVAEALPFRDGTADAVVSMDVVEHLDDDVAALEEYVRVCRPGAVVLLTVPAYGWLWGEHDDRAAHRRRYTARSLRHAVEAAGLTVERCTYYYAFLLPPAVLARKTPLRRVLAESDEEAAEVHPVVAWGFGLLSSLERRWLRRHDLPAGLSLALVARVPDAR